ncbi:uncharacterized protein LOC111943840, partial [Cyanistes caeruleus]|uniref:uncharacterized protein LOC111943840 n=1 Tax=Cyanistes caeruleus TaxID=156563 RepID=UPI000CDA93DE
FERSLVPEPNPELLGEKGSAGTAGQCPVPIVPALLHQPEPRKALKHTQFETSPFSLPHWGPAHSRRCRGHRRSRYRAGQGCTHCCLQPCHSSVQIDLPPTLNISRGLPGVYTAVQMHLHWGGLDLETSGSEHTIDGMRYFAELHIVHYNSENYSSFEEAKDKPQGLAVLAFLYTVRVTQAVLAVLAFLYMVCVTQAVLPVLAVLAVLAFLYT